MFLFKIKKMKEFLLGVPIIIKQPEYYYTNQSGEMYLFLKCRATGIPFPRICWYRNGIEKVFE